jgi:hypothetical protein
MRRMHGIADARFDLVSTALAEVYYYFYGTSFRRRMPV